MKRIWAETPLKRGTEARAIVAGKEVKGHVIRVITSTGQVLFTSKDTGVICLDPVYIAAEQDIHEGSKLKLDEETAENAEELEHLVWCLDNRTEDEDWCLLQYEVKGLTVISLREGLFS